ncbi:hypothetical protein DOTSEDRAFT_56443 [Dothistroma septosporum NZE10]|uniref:GPI anchored protein n=1 Tax=Dothistroma septosporum (strain NZE10 / CBS 128990) TaxID=675120 RepID=N1PFZ1_DOTSN|nr:hypothetical protein DOTSEDRAFT_56443 [Dothistroma septosporum NZE10]
MQNKLVTLTAAAAMAGMAFATDSVSNGQRTSTVLETITSTASICPATAVGLPEVTVTSTVVVSTTVEGKDCGSASTPIVTETKTITGKSPSSQLSSNEVGPTTDGVVGASKSEGDSTVQLTSTVTAQSTVLTTISTTTSTNINTLTTTPNAIYSIPGNSSSVIGTGTGALPSGTGAVYPTNSVTPFDGGAATLGMSSILALGAMAAGAFYLF